LIKSSEVIAYICTLISIQDMSHASSPWRMQTTCRVACMHGSLLLSLDIGANSCSHACMQTWLTLLAYTFVYVYRVFPNHVIARSHIYGENYATKHLICSTACIYYSEYWNTCIHSLYWWNFAIGMFVQPFCAPQMSHYYYLIKRNYGIILKHPVC
jgi:hypothetical protein